MEELDFLDEGWEIAASESADGRSESTRRTIHFSSHALRTIQDDMATFTPELTHLADYLKIIFTNYNDNAKCNLPERLENNKKYCKNAVEALYSDSENRIFSKLSKKLRATANKSSEFKNELVAFTKDILAEFQQEFLNQYKEELNQAFDFEHLPSEEKSKPKMSSHLQKFNDQWEKCKADEFYGKPKKGNDSSAYEPYTADQFIPKYLQLLFEEYASLPMYEREKICFKDTYEDLNKAIQNKQWVDIVLKKHYNTRTQKYEEQKFFLRPYKILPDKMQTYAYFVGLADGKEKNDPSQTCCFRLSRIKEVTRHNWAKSSIKKDEEARIKKEILEKEVQYLSGNGDPETIKVRFTKAGLDGLERHIFQRPYFDRKSVVKNGNFYEVEFKCTAQQAHNYLFKFDSNACILEPQILHDNFQKRYAGSYNVYLQYEDKPQEIVVRFDEQGLQLLEDLRCMRPDLPRKFKARDILKELQARKGQGEIEEISYTHTFHCGERQALDYFYSFGKHARIVSPASLREAFKARYLEAYNAYIDENE